MKYTYTFVFIVTFIFGFSCQNQDTQFPDNFVFPDWAISIQHHEYFIDVSPEDKQQCDKAISAIMDLLSEKKTIMDADLFPGSQLTPPLRERDFLALFLARIFDVKINLYTYDDTSKRDEKIVKLLESIKQIRGDK